MNRPYRYDEKERMRRKSRYSLPHPAGGSKVCPRCGKTFMRLVQHIPSRWDATSYCSRECGRPVKIPVTQEAFEGQVSPEPNSGCWLWMGGFMLVNGRYPRAKIWSLGKHRFASRFAWEMYKGPIPAGLEVCHKCDNGMCVNPQHFFLGTHQDNMDDMVRKGRRPKQIGESHPVARLTDAQALAALSDPRTAKVVAAELGVSKSTISALRRGQNWGHLHVPKA
jgi:hypothetical protein